MPGVTMAARAPASNGATLGIERHLWATADRLRGHLDVAEYKHVVLGLIFLKYISDNFERRHAELEAQVDEGADPEDKDEYLAERVFYVPKEARWSFIQAQAKTPEIGVVIDRAMEAIERDNPKQLRDALPKGYARPTLDKERLGGVVDLISGIGLGKDKHQAQDILGRIYEYFLGQFASAEGKQGGEFYTPSSVVQVLVGMLAPYKGRVYDPCCGSGGLFVQSERFVEAHGGNIGDISIFGQESNPTTWRLARMNLALRGIDANLGTHADDTFRNDLHPDLRADYILANPPFNISDWGGERLREDKRWQFGVPPVGNANYAWVQHIISKLRLRGTAGFVLANGSLSVSGVEGEIRRKIVEADLVDCIVALPGQLFYSTQIPVCLWFLARDKTGGIGEGGQALRCSGSRRDCASECADRLGL
jgi:type I restriction enzyme M protein